MRCTYSIRQHTFTDSLLRIRQRVLTYADVRAYSIRQHTSLRPARARVTFIGDVYSSDASAYVSIRQHTTAYVSANTPLRPRARVTLRVTLGA